MSSDSFDPFGNYFFALEINSEEVGSFMECSGLKTSSEVYEIHEGGLNGYAHKRPGQSKWENIVLRYATNFSTSLIEWRDKFLQDQFNNRVTGSIKLMNNDGSVVRRYDFEGAWPVSWEGAGLNSGGSELAIETLEIAHTGLKIS